MHFRLSFAPLATLAVLLAPSAADAQSNPFIVFPQDPERQTITSASYVRRPDWNLAAEGFQEIGPSTFRGVGDRLGACSVVGFFHWAADENVATSETYGIVLRRGTATPGNGPDPTPAGEILRITGLVTPTSGAGGRGSFVMTDVFSTAIGVPCDGEWFQGIDFPANPAWPNTDGHSLWSADLPGISPAVVGENPRTGSPKVTWRIGTAGAVATTDWTYIMGAMVETPTFHVGGEDPLSTRLGAPGANYGMGGLFPDVSGAPRRDGIRVRIHDNAVPNGIALFVLAAGFSPVAIPLPSFFGRLYADPATLIPLAAVNMSGGAAELTVAPPNAVPTSLAGASLVFQGLVFNVSTSTGAFANAQRSAF